MSLLSEEPERIKRQYEPGFERKPQDYYKPITEKPLLMLLCVILLIGVAANLWAETVSDGLELVADKKQQFILMLIISIAVSVSLLFLIPAAIGNPRDLLII